MKILLLLFLSIHCVLVSSQAQLGWNCANTPNGCNNACFSAFCQGAAGVLIRNNPPPMPDRDINRRRSGCALHPCTLPGGPPGTACDEYPFASSAQGGFGATLRCIPVAESLSQGGIIGSFVQHQNIPVGGAYQVFVLNAGAGSPYCQPGAACLGDNWEFHIPFVLFRRRELQTSLVKPQFFPNTTTAKAPKIVKPRRFVTQNNLELTLLASSSTENYIGSQVYVTDGVRDGQLVEIVSEIKTDDAGVISTDLRA